MAGNVVIEPRFAGTLSFSGGLAAVWDDQATHLYAGLGSYYIDREGAIIWEPSAFERASGTDDIASYLLDPGDFEDLVAGEIEREVYPKIGYLEGLPGHFDWERRSEEGLEQLIMADGVDRYDGACGASLPDRIQSELATAYMTMSSDEFALHPPTVQQSIGVFGSASSARSAHEWLRDEAYECEQWPVDPEAFPEFYWEFSVTDIPGLGQEAFHVHGIPGGLNGTDAMFWDLVVIRYGRVIVTLDFAGIGDDERIALAQRAVNRLENQSPS